MKLFAILLGCCCAWVLPALAQEGYPLDGTWRGYWGPDGEAGTLALLVMAWDGEQITGRINPGRNTIHIEQASLDAANWQLRVEATSTEGEPIVITGVLDDIGSYNRTLTGTWTQAGTAYPLILTRE